MKQFKSGIFSLLVAALFLLIAAGAHAGTVQVDPTGGSTYSITGIENFDWSNTSGTAAIEESITVTPYDAVTNSYGTAYTTTFALYFASTNIDSRNSGDIVNMNVHAQTILTGFSGTSFADNSSLDIDYDGVGTGVNGDYEITMVTSFSETATYVQNLTPSGSNTILTDQLVFTGAAGTFEFYLDTTPDADSAQGTGFIESVGYNPFLVGDVVSSSDAFITTTTFDNLINMNVLSISSSGSNTLNCTVTGYDQNVINTDPTGGGYNIVGSNFTTQLKLSTDTAVTFLGLEDGGYIGLDTDNDNLGDFVYDANNGQGISNALILYADSGSNFQVGNTTIPEPGTMILFGLGLVGIAGLGRRRKS